MKTKLDSKLVSFMQSVQNQIAEINIRNKKESCMTSTQPQNFPRRQWRQKSQFQPQPIQQQRNTTYTSTSPRGWCYGRGQTCTCGMQSHIEPACFRKIREWYILSIG